MNKYHFVKTYTTNYYYEIEAEGEEDAFNKMMVLNPEQADASKNIDVVTSLEKIEEPSDEELDDVERFNQPIEE